MKLNTILISTFYMVFGLQQSFANTPFIEYKFSPLYGDKHLSEFYRWNEKIPTQPGLLLRTEPLDEGIRLKEASDQYRILFSSTNGIDSRSATVVSGSLFIPKGKAPAEGWPLLVWGHGTVGLADQCAPSWAGRVYRNAYYLNQWLKQGYAIVEPDYQGLGVVGPHWLINVPQLSFNILDSARAALKTQHQISNRIIIAGQSQGGVAAFGAATYAESYASDLNIKGTIATGVIYKPKQTERPTINIANRNLPNPALAYQILGFHVLQQYDPSLKVEEVFTPKAFALVEHSRAQCASEIFADVNFEKLSFNDALLAQPSEKYQKLQAKFDQKYGAYPTLKIKHPVFIGTGADDRTPDARNQMQLVKDACAAGTQVQAHLYHGLGHSEAVPRSLQDAIPFAQLALNDQAIPDTCSINLE